MVDVDAKIRTLEIRLNNIRYELNFYRKLQRQKRVSQNIPSLLFEALTEKQTRVITLKLKGHSTNEVAQILKNSPSTIKMHLTLIYAALGVSGFEQLKQKMEARSEQTSTSIHNGLTANNAENSVRGLPGGAQSGPNGVCLTSGKAS